MKSDKTLSYSLFFLPLLAIKFYYRFINFFIMDIAKVKANLVVSSNDLVHAKYDLSLWQKRVFVYAISQLEKEEKDFAPLKMGVYEIIKYFKSNGGVAIYKAILESPKSLDTTIQIPYITPEGHLRYGFIKLLQKYTIPADNQLENQYIEIHFNNDLKTHLLDLKEKFLKYDIRNIVDLQSTYSFRMFEILKSYEYRKEVELEIDYLREILEVTTIYKSYKDFKRRIIDKAQEDLTKFCDVTFDCEPKKGLTGKRIQSLVFHIHKNKPKNREDAEPSKNAKEDTKSQSEGLFAQREQPESNPAQEKLIMELSPTVVTKFGVSLKMFISLVENYTEGVIRQAVQITEKMMNKGKVENIAGFFVGAVRGQYIEPEQKKKHEDTEKKAKAEAIKKTEKESAEKKIRASHDENERKMAILKKLINEKSPLIAEAIAEVKTGMFSKSYNPSKSIEDNLADARFAGLLMFAVSKLDAKIFN